ncbi:MAG: excinuclease ABC subunit UvrA [Deltaproteobacteria bacterium]|nr:excinuclease ABC subunit UvrA [Deltaproteobacteria bacterium]MBW2013771.1 excinuclease ABC subunit UvrA [Deltaproteobacteria bacterium]MBW2089100.1 excinuclease ABC subunit UvrA [Deltaproteobacteria bacterium]MBW2320646.1 excinuclease ABC subunit UvrA [Deltaproteobacteria bacterium]
MKTEKIFIRGARQHNLKNIDVELPRNKLIVVTGISGSGKSTLAFDTLYAEGQRRYVESLSTYARQFLERMEKPDVDMIEGLSPAIAIEQKTASHNPRSTVGTVTEIYDYLRLLFARVGTPHCYKCGQPITSQTLDQILDKVLSLSRGTRIVIMAPLVSGQKGTHDKLFKRLKKEGFARVRVDGKTMEIEEAGGLDKYKKHTIDVVVDRLVVKEKIKNRLADSLELAMSQSDGLVTVDVLGTGPVLFSEKSACISCGISYPEFTPASFSFNSPQGACPKCEGLGSTTEFDPDLIIPNHELSLREGAVALWANRNTVHFIEFLDALTSHYGVDIYTPYKNLPDHFKHVLLYGSGKDRIRFYFERNNRRFTYEKRFEGIIPKLERRYLETQSYQSREEIKRYMNFRHCPECHGAKLNRASRSVKVGGLTIFETTQLTVASAHTFFNKLKLTGKKEIIAKRILKEINERLGFLENVGLSYLTLDRSAYTLSGGEGQRIRLATQIGSKLTGVLYVLDEPSIGLHQRDNQRLLETLLQMRDLGNTVLVVEHDEETIRASDHVVDMGPGAGVRGGEVVFSGTPEALLNEKKSLTGQYLSGRKYIEVPSNRRIGHKKKLIIKGASQNNLKNIQVEFPLGCFICITGVSGSGKSSLILETLYHVLAQRLYHARMPAGNYSKVLGVEYIDKVINIDQSPIGRTPRSNPGTYTGVFTYIRELFSRTPEARMRGYKPGRFSFNVKGGRCEACRGDGIIKIEMHFLPDVYVACDVCRGKRYNRETLEIKYKGKNIADILDMTANQSFSFFEKINNIRSKLQTLIDVGLGYIHIGQPATTLSGGEAQRVKLSRELSKKGTGNTVYILDEPTTGLHMDDINKLLNVLSRLVQAGNTVIVIEHNMDVIKTADHIIDLGPEGGDEGGNIVGCGTPEQIANISGSYTGQFLKKVLA